MSEPSPSTAKLLAEMDEKITKFSKYIETVPAADRPYVQEKLLSAKLMREKLKAMTALANVQNILAEMNVLTAKNKLKDAIEQLENCRKDNRDADMADKKKTPEPEPAPNKHEKQTEKTTKTQPESTRDKENTHNQNTATTINKNPKLEGKISAKPINLTDRRQSTTTNRKSHDRTMTATNVNKPTTSAAKDIHDKTRTATTVNKSTATTVDENSHDRTKTATTVVINSHDRTKTATTVDKNSHNRTRTATTVDKHSHGSTKMATVDKNSHDRTKTATTVNKNSHDSTKTATTVNKNTHDRTKTAATVDKNSHDRTKTATAVHKNSHDRTKTTVHNNPHDRTKTATTADKNSQDRPKMPTAVDKPSQDPRRPATPTERGIKRRHNSKEKTDAKKQKTSSSNSSSSISSSISSIDQSSQTNWLEQVQTGQELQRIIEDDAETLVLEDLSPSHKNAVNLSKALQQVMKPNGFGDSKQILKEEFPPRLPSKMQLLFEDDPVPKEVSRVKTEVPDDLLSTTEELVNDLFIDILKAKMHHETNNYARLNHISCKRTLRGILEQC